MAGKGRNIINFFAIVCFILVVLELSHLPTGRTVGQKNESGAFLDFTKSMAITKAVIQRQEKPYDMTEYNLSDELGTRLFNEKLSLYPGKIFFLLPFSTLNLVASARLWFFISFISLCFIIVYLLLKTGSVPQLDTETFGRCALSVLFVLRSQPVVRDFYLGQTAIITSVVLLAAVFCQKHWIRAFLLSCATALKYSLVPVFILMFLAKRQYVMCLAAMGLFILWSIVPIFFGYNLIEFYKDYVLAMVESYGVRGPNWYGSVRWDFDFLHFGFFKSDWLNFFGKAVVVIILMIALWRERKRPTISLNFMLLASSSTMVLWYHRSYDLVLVEIMIILVCNQLYLQNRWIDFWVCTGFLFGFAAPMTFVIPFSTYVGNLIGENVLIYLGSNGKWMAAIPILGILTYIFTLYSTYFYFCRRESFEWELT